MQRPFRHLIRGIHSTAHLFFGYLVINQDPDGMADRLLSLVFFSIYCPLPLPYLCYPWPPKASLCFQILNFFKFSIAQKTHRPFEQCAFLKLHWSIIYSFQLLFFFSTSSSTVSLARMKRFLIFSSRPSLSLNECIRFTVSFMYPLR